MFFDLLWYCTPKFKFWYKIGYIQRDMNSLLLGNNLVFILENSPQKNNVQYCFWTRKYIGFFNLKVNYTTFNWLIKLIDILKTGSKYKKSEVLYTLFISKENME